MTFLRTPEDHPLFAADQASKGYIANYTKLFSLCPDAYTAWAQLNSVVRAAMDLRRYELVTLAAARELKSSYCSLAHGKLLRDKFFDAPTVQAMAADPADAGLDETDVAIMAFASKVARNATSVTAEDVDELRAHGLSDEDIFHIILTVGMRCFFSTVLDAAGALPDAAFRSSLEPGLQQALVVGRPIAAE